MIVEFIEEDVILHTFNKNSSYEEVEPIVNEIKHNFNVIKTELEFSENTDFDYLQEIFSGSFDNSKVIKQLVYIKKKNDR